MKKLINYKFIILEKNYSKKIYKEIKLKIYFEIHHNLYL